MIKNVFLPLILIILTSAATIYLWYEDFPLSLFGLIGFVTLGFGNMYLSYFIFYKIFPNEANRPLPPLQDLMIQNHEAKSKPQVFTKGSLFGTLLAVVLSVGGIYSWVKIADKYKNYHLENYGKLTKAVVIDVGYSKGIGTYREYEYNDDKSKKYTDKFSNETLYIGDTLSIIYSTDRPIINKVVSEDDEE